MADQGSEGGETSVVVQSIRPQSAKPRARRRSAEHVTVTVSGARAQRRESMSAARAVSAQRIYFLYSIGPT